MTLSKDQAEWLIKDVGEIKDFLLGNKFHEGFKREVDTKFMAHEVRIDIMESRKESINRYINKTVAKAFVISIATIGTITAILVVIIK